MAICALAAPCLLGISAWRAHNATHFDNATFSTAGTFQLLYVRAASVMYQATELDLKEVYAILARRVEEPFGTDLQDVDATWRHAHIGVTSDKQAVMTDVALDVFREYPLYYVLTIPVGIYRMFIAVTAWPAVEGFLWNVGFTLAAALGSWHLLKTRQFAIGLFLALPSLYFMTGTLLVATASYDTRARVMVTPLLAIMAAYGVHYLITRRRAASAAPAPRADN